MSSASIMRFFSVGESKTIQSVNLHHFYQANVPHFARMAEKALSRVQTKSGNARVIADDVYPDLMGRLVLDGQYKGHMGSAHPWIPLLNHCDVYTRPFAKYILVKRFAGGSYWWIP